MSCIIRCAAAQLLNFVGFWSVTTGGWKAGHVQGTQRRVRQRFRGWHPDIQACIRSIDVPYKWALFGAAAVPRWSMGRVTLLGDACHSMLPMLAQGAVMAMEDGYVLARCLAAIRRGA